MILKKKIYTLRSWKRKAKLKTITTTTETLFGKYRAWKKEYQEFV